MRHYLAFALTAALAIQSPALANAWEKNYRPVPNSDGTIMSTSAPEIVGSSGDMEKDLEAMWRRGYGLIGYTIFRSDNSKTADAVKLAKKLKARYFIASTSLASSRTASIPLTTPTSSTTMSRGTASAYGSGGSATGHYSGTSTTYGSQTTYIPFTINSFDKVGAFFREVPKSGIGVFVRELTNEEMATLGTRKAFAVKYVRDGSPAYNADIFPGDIVMLANGVPLDPPTWRAAMSSEQPIKLGIIRNGQSREIVLAIPEEWRWK